MIAQPVQLGPCFRSIEIQVRAEEKGVQRPSSVTLRVTDCGKINKGYAAHQFGRMDAHVGKLVSGRMDDRGRSRKGHIEKIGQELRERCPAVALVEMKGMYDIAFLHNQLVRRLIERRIQKSKALILC